MSDQAGDTTGSGSDGAAERVLGRVAEAGGKLLRAERAMGPAAAPARLRLTFDLGAVEIAPDAEGAALRATPAAPSPAGDEELHRAPAGDQELHRADEESPWWTLLGHPLTRVAVREAGTLLLQFRPDDASPKILTLEPAAGAVRIRTVV